MNNKDKLIILVLHEDDDVYSKLAGCLDTLEEDLNRLYFKKKNSSSCKLECRRFHTIDKFAAVIEKEVLGDFGELPLILVISDLKARPTQDSEPVVLVDQNLSRDTFADSLSAEFLEKSFVGGEKCSFIRWLRRLLPAIPLVVLSDEEVNLTFSELPGARFEFVSSDRLDDSAEFVPVLLRFLLRHWQTPFWNQLKEHAILGHDTWFCPGHNKGSALIRSNFVEDFGRRFAPNSGLALSADVSISIGELGDLSEPLQPGTMRSAMSNSAQVFGASLTLYSTNGTSTANKVMLMALLRPGDVVVVTRDCHKSIHQAIVVSGATPFYIDPYFNHELGIWCPVSINQIKSAFHELSQLGIEARALILSTCTYEGILYPVNEIARLCDKKGILLYADEAWLPHGRFHPFYCRCDLSQNRFNALGTGDGEGAHCVVQSTHKVLSALSQGSMVHIGQPFVQCFDRSRKPQFEWLQRRFETIEVFYEYLADVNRYWLTTSPNYPIIASLDCATAQMAGEGISVVGKMLEHAKILRDSLGDAAVTMEDIVGTKKVEFEDYLLDPLKLAVGVKTGEDHAEAVLCALNESFIRWDKSEFTNGKHVGGHVFFIVLAGTTVGNRKRLKITFNDLRDHIGWNSDKKVACKVRPVTSGQVEFVPREAHYAIGEFVTLQEAENRVACQMLVPYPPGIPVVLPGLRIGKAEIRQITRIANADPMKVHGLLRKSGQYLVRVLTSEEERNGLNRLNLHTSES